MSSIRFVLDRGGVRELLKSGEIAAECMQHAQSIRSSAGPNYEASVRNYPERTGAAVHPANADGLYDNLRNNTLLKALG